MKLKESYKDTEVEIIPKDWDVRTLGSLGYFFKGKGIKKNEVIPEGIKCVRYGELYTKYNNVIDNVESCISEQTTKSSQLIEFGDVLFAGSGEKKEEIGKSSVLLTREPVYAGGDIVVLRSRNVSPLFLGYLLNSEPVAKEKSLYGQGDAVVHIYSSGLIKVKIQLPPTIEEQEKIAKVLSDTDKLIQALEQKIEKKKHIKKGAMQELLTPKDDWVENPLTEVVDYIHGKAHEQDIDEYGKYVVVNSKFISTEGEVRKHANKNHCPAVSGDILTVLSDIPNGKALAKCFMVTEDDKYTVNQRICIWRAKSDDIPEFLFFILNRNSHFLALNDGVNQTNIGNGDIEKCVLKVPSVERQRAIAQVLNDMNLELEGLELSLNKYKTLKKGLMQQLLTGKTRLV